MRRNSLRNDWAAALGSTLARAGLVARGDAEDFVTEQSGIFEIRAAPPSSAEDGPWGVMIGFVLMSMLYGTVAVVAYLHIVLP